MVFSLRQPKSSTATLAASAEVDSKDAKVDPREASKETVVSVQGQGDGVYWCGSESDKK